MSGKGAVRTERDSMGELEVPADALWAAQTQRAVQNFPISGRTLPAAFIQAVGLIKTGTVISIGRTYESGMPLFGSRVFAVRGTELREERQRWIDGLEGICAIAGSACASGKPSNRWRSSMPRTSSCRCRAAGGCAPIWRCLPPAVSRIPTS